MVKYVLAALALKAFQVCDWIDRIGSAGFGLPEPIAETADVSGLPIAPVFGNYR